MEVGYFDTVQDVKEKLQSRRGWPAASTSLLHNGALLEDDVDGVGGGGSGSGIERHGVVEGSVIHVALLDGAQHQQQPAAEQEDGEEQEAWRRRAAVAAASGDRRVAVRRGPRGGGRGRARRGVGAARGAGVPFPLPRDGAYFFIHGQSVMDESRSFEWHGVASGDEVVVFDGSVTRNPA